MLPTRTNACPDHHGWWFLNCSSTARWILSSSSSAERMKSPQFPKRNVSFNSPQITDLLAVDLISCDWKCCLCRGQRAYLSTYSHVIFQLKMSCLQHDKRFVAFRVKRISRDLIQGRGLNRSILLQTGQEFQTWQRGEMLGQINKKNKKQKQTKNLIV